MTAGALDQQIGLLRQRADALRRRAGAQLAMDRAQDDLPLLTEVLEALGLALEQLRAVQAVSRTSAREWQATLDAIDDGVCLLGLEGTVLRCNRAMADLVDRPLSELVGHSCCQLMHGSPEPIEGCPLARMRQSHCRQSLVVSLAGRWLQVTAHPIRDEGGELTGAVLILSDITERRRAEETWEVLEAQLRQAQKMEAVGRLASGVAHDFNNLLTPILGYSQRLVARLPGDDPRRGDIQQILKAGQRAASLSRQLLLFSRRQTPRLRPLDLNELVANMERMLTRVIGEEMRLTTILDPVLYRVRADPGQMEQVIMNLALNARDAMVSMHGGMLTIRTENVTLPGDADADSAALPEPWVRLSVADTGVGMDDEVVGHLFEPFFTTKEQGTGLGLAIVYGIVRGHGGRIDAHSRAGQGSAFEVYLPALVSTPAKTREMEAAGPGGPLGRGEGILVVEDDEWVRQFAAQVLGRSGYAVFEAETLAQAQEVLERQGHHIDLVFADVVLADGTGLELANQLLARQADARVLLSSGYTDDRSRLPAIRERGLPFIQKPYTLPELLQAVREAMEHKGGEACP